MTVTDSAQKIGIAAIELAGLTKYYPGANAPAVDAIDLTIHEGEFLCLLGPSGCGKSTTLRMIAGLETPSAGTITVAGTTVDNVETAAHIPAEKRNLSLVFQNYALWPHMSVKDNVSFGPKNRKLGKARTKELVADALDTLAISQYADRYPSELSGGQQQRVAIARTLASASTILLLDEPLSNLDARLRLEMRSEFQRIHQETGSTMVFVTHDQWEAMTLATRIVVMNEGTIQQEGTPMEIYGKPANRFVAEFMGSPPINIIEREGNTSSSKALSSWLEAIGTRNAGSAGIRPEDLRFGDEESMPIGTLSLEVEVTGVLPTGGSWIIEATSGSNRLFGTTSRMPQIETGQRTTAWANADAIHLFDRAGIRIDT